MSVSQTPRRRLPVSAVVAAALASTAGCATAPPSAVPPPPTVTVTVTVGPSPAPTPAPTTATTSPSPASPSTRDATSPHTLRDAPAEPCPPARSEPVRHAPGRGRTVALTFDDGPGGQTQDIRAVLRRYGVRATFFDVGERSVAHPGDEADLVADGHLLAGHSWDHRYPREVPWTEAHLRDQMRRTSALLHPRTRRPVCFFRPPGGVMENVMPAAEAENLSVVLWSHDTADWRQPSRTTTTATRDIVARATNDPGDHPIVLLHAAKASHEPESRVGSNRSNTVAALPRIIEWYLARDYRFVDLEGGSGLTP